MLITLPLVAILSTVPAPVVQPTDPPSMTVVVHGEKKLAVSPVEKLEVKGEEHVLGDGQPTAWHGGTSPKMVLGPIDTEIRLPLALDPASMVVRAKDGRVYQEGKDYTLDHYWGGIGRIASGAIKSDEAVLIDYTVSLQRVDAVQMSADGMVSIKKGEPARVCPKIPEVDPGCTRLANIFLPFHCKAITRENIFIIKDPKLTWRSFIHVEGGAYLAGTKKLLKDGQKLKIVCYGDSVTVGCSTSTPDKCFVGLLKPELSKKFTKADITVVNAGIGGTNTDGRLPAMDKEVLSFDPDLVVVEFVNDMNFTPEQLRKNYTQMIDRLRAHNPKAEMIILTPHFTRADWMGGFQRSRQVLKEIAAEKKVALGDTSAIWERLGEVGIPYQTLLANEINHPEDLGHRFFVETILALL